MIVTARRRTRRAPVSTVVSTVVLLVAAAAATAGIHRVATGTWHELVAPVGSGLSTLDPGTTTIVVLGVAAALVGVVLLWAAVVPGRRDGWLLSVPDPGSRPVDVALASRAVARRAARTASLQQGVRDASARARGRTVTVHVATLAADQSSVRGEVAAEVAKDLGDVGLQPPPRVRVVVSRGGV